jgi:hypothetical protein
VTSTKRSRPPEEFRDPAWQLAPGKLHSKLTLR